MQKQMKPTLPEWIVIALLIGWLSLLFIPLSSTARQHSKTTLCLANTHLLSRAWLAYAEDNDGFLCGGNTFDDEQWIGPPLREDGFPITTNIPVTLEEEIRGFQAGQLWPYTMTEKIYHCPADNHWNLWNRGYRSTSIQGMMNGEVFPMNPGYVTKISQIAFPGEKFVFVENVDPRGWNMGSWIMNPAIANSPRLIDPIAVFHTSTTTLGFVDGHVESHRWLSEGLLKWAHQATEYDGTFSFNFTPLTDKERDDVHYLAKGYIPGPY
ncbi:MAG: hypothetical protein JXA82_08460 [Sedimentisphaerales bacterium]|nr:hypothetical protein [Sedimentisphaerales bacterium]